MATRSPHNVRQELVQPSLDFTSSQFELLEEVIDDIEPAKEQRSKPAVNLQVQPEEAKASSLVSPTSRSPESPIKSAISGDFSGYITTKSPGSANATTTPNASNPFHAHNVLQSDYDGHDMPPTDDESEDSHFQCKECLFYLLFLIIFTLTAVFSIGTGDLNFAQTSSIRIPLVLKDQFYGWNNVSKKTYDDVSTIADIYSYLRQVLVPFLLSKPRFVNDTNLYYVQNRHVLLGGVRIRQIRLEPNECDICFNSHIYRSNINGACDTDLPHLDTDECYHQSAIDRENVTFSASETNQTWVYSYTDSEVLLDQRYQGYFNHYPGGGYIQDLPLNYSQSVAIIDFLEDIQWLDAATLMVSVDFNVYNPSDSLHTVARLVWEMPTGGIFSNDEIKTWKFDRYHGEVSGSVLFIVHVVFAMLVVIISGMMAVDIYRHYSADENEKKKKFWSKWRMLDMLNIVIFYVTMVLLLYNESVQKNRIDLFDTTQFYSFRRLQALSQLEAYSFAVNGFLLWFKLFRYLGFHPKFRFLFYMMSRGWQDLVMFMVILFVFYLAFAFSGFLIFGSDVLEYRTLGWSIISMNNYFLQEINYQDLVASSRFVGNIYYILWIVWMSFILVNVFIAILIDAYSKTQVEIELDATNVGYFNVFEKGREYVKQLQEAVLASAFDAFNEDGDDNVDVDEIAHALKISVEEAQGILNRFDTDGNGVLDRKEFESLKQRLIREKMDHVDDHDVYMQLKEDGSLQEQVSEMRELMNLMLSVDPAGKRALRQKQSQGDKWKYNRKNSVK